jgi:hypothetical protein
VIGITHGPNGPPSRLHSKVADGSSEEYSNVAFRDLVLFLGCFVIVVSSGATVSIVKVVSAL